MATPPAHGGQPGAGVARGAARGTPRARLSRVPNPAPPGVAPAAGGPRAGQVCAPGQEQSREGRRGRGALAESSDHSHERLMTAFGRSVGHAGLQGASGTVCVCVSGGAFTLGTLGFLVQVTGASGGFRTQGRQSQGSHASQPPALRWRRDRRRGRQSRGQRDAGLRDRGGPPRHAGRSGWT